MWPTFMNVCRSAPKLWFYKTMTDKSNSLIMDFSRRKFVSGGLGACVLGLTGCASDNSRVSDARQAVRRGLRGPRDYTKIYAALPNEKFPIPAVKLAQVEPRFRRREVRNKTGEAPGTIVVDTRNFYLFWTMPEGRAMRYGVGLGRAGFEWSGRARVAWKRPWPKWTPPAEMIERQPELEKWSAANGGMPPGLDNPLGARALYIFEGDVDTLYRLHGTPEAFSIGKAVSSGCVRLLNQDVIDLYDRVPSNTPIVVL